MYFENNNFKFKKERKKERKGKESNSISNIDKGSPNKKGLDEAGASCGRALVIVISRRESGRVDKMRLRADNCSILDER